MRVFYLLAVVLFSFTNLNAQKESKKILDHEDFDIWKEIVNPLLSNDGRWVAYELQPGEGDPQLALYDGQNNREKLFSRADQAAFSADSRFLVFRIHPPVDTVRHLRRQKVKKDKLPKDTLAIYRLHDGELVKIPNLKSYKLPQKWAGWLAYHVEMPKAKVTPGDSAQVDKKVKKEADESAGSLVIRNLETEEETLVEFVKDYIFAKEGPRFLLTSAGKDSIFLPGVYLFDCESPQLRPLFRQKGNYKQLILDDQGRQAAFLADLDTTKALIRPFSLYHWQTELDSARLVAGNDAEFLPPGRLIGEHGALSFSKDGTRLFFGIAPQPILQDTSLLEEEIVNVEVWAYADPRIYTQEKVLLDREKKRTYLSVYHTGNDQFRQLASEDLPEVRIADEGNAPFALGYNEYPYLLQASWKGRPTCKDVFVINIETGESILVATQVCGNPAISPQGNYLYWYSEPDSAWFAYSIHHNQVRQLTSNREALFYNELNDRPAHPSSYGIAGWLKDDASVLIYDRYDIWKIDPQAGAPPVNLTNKRREELTLRYIELDPEKRFFNPDERILTHVFNHRDKTEGYLWLDIGKGPGAIIHYGKYQVSRRPLKAREVDRWLFSKENFKVFPDLLYGPSLSDYRLISSANPQQKEYRWGSAELYEWTSLDGKALQGMLIKPDNFDPSKKYPMIVYFYERFSDNLHRHWRPFPHRSIINFSFYASRGYIIFIPDIVYKTGYPGPSAYNCVMPGVTSLIGKGFVDKERIGVQGHSWGGYQSAYLISQTDIFRCAESGAPVVNMLSAYGGIRWESGLSRMFQYEQDQSRIGGAIWDYPLRYVENSPIFFVDRINTPVLIMHNDKDGAVPWYQGIEFFTALRRLGKPAWMLNYNDEPHWPVKLQNRKDFQRRMQQFFDHYLKDSPKPEWMERGVPPIEKGIRQGFEPAGQ
jgi:dienelactone hydrolase